MRNRFHSLCPYFAMFPETFVETWLSRIAKPRDVVLDPFCGRGTTPFQAVLMGYRALATDINPVAYCVTRAKTNAPAPSTLRRRVTQLERRFKASAWEAERRRLPVFFEHAYAPSTARQLLFLRKNFRWKMSNTDCMLAAMTLGALHGESQKSPLYLSNQMPRTISTKPGYSVRFWQGRDLRPPSRDAFAVLRSLIDYRYKSDRPNKHADVFMSDMRSLPRLPYTKPRRPRVVITSPPYLDITNYEEDQWLRLWFLGHAPHPTYRKISADDRHEREDQYWALLADMWRVLGHVLAPAAEIVIRIGAKRIAPARLATGLTETGKLSRRKVRLIGEPEVSTIRGRQTRAFRPDSLGCLIEVDCHFHMA